MELSPNENQDVGTERPIDTALPEVLITNGAGIAITNTTDSGYPGTDGLATAPEISSESLVLAPSELHEVRGAAGNSEIADHQNDAPSTPSLVFQETGYYQFPEEGDINIHASDRDIDIRHERAQRRYGNGLHSQRRFVSYPCGCMLFHLECGGHEGRCPICDGL